MLLALLAVLAIVGAVLYTSLFQSGGDRTDREVAENQDAAPAPADRQDDELTTYPLPSAEPEPAPLPAEGALPPAERAPGAAPAAEPEDRELAEAAPPAAVTPSPAPAAEEEAGGGSDGLAAVRAFYSALSRGDGASAAQHVVPGKRQSGPLSAAQLSRYYSSFRRPLRVRELTPVDDNTVRVAYDYVLSDGRACRGEATVNVVQSGGRGLVSGINTRGPC